MTTSPDAKKSQGGGVRVAIGRVTVILSGLMGLMGLAVLAAVVLASSACQVRERSAPTPGRDAGPAPAPPPVNASAAREPAPAAAASDPVALPAITGEPEIRLLIARGPVVEVHLRNPARTAAGATLQPGSHRAALIGGRATIGGIAAEPGAAIHLAFAGTAPDFSLGSPSRDFAGELVVAVAPDAKGVVLLEVLPMERYLLGVLAKEVEPDWPLEALKAQAVAARSYATAAWLGKRERLWQLDASEQVDMAYAGHVAEPHRNLATALAQTRGDLLWFADQPLPAYFFASSGGHTEDIAAVWPDRTLPDGCTSPAPAMPPQLDPWDRAGRAVAPQRLGAWRVELDLATVAERLRRAGHAGVGRLRDLRITASDHDSGRARRLRVTGDAGVLDLTAHDFRMAMGSTTVKSTLWRDFRLDGNSLVIQGHGYGHGIGLPQASAWAMARANHLAPAILARYYPGARLVRKW